MGRIKQFHHPGLSLWQSAVDEVVASRKAGPPTPTLAAPRVVGQRPDTSHLMVREATSYCDAADSGRPLPETAAPPGAAEDLLHTASFCSLTALKLAKAIILRNQDDQKRYKEELAKFGDCDPGYAEAAAKYAEYFVAQGKEIPYRTYSDIGDFVIKDKLSDPATVAVVADWGTGQDAAKRLLEQIARKDPDVVIHLGDIYYSGTEFEAATYFYKPWTEILNLAANEIPTFTLSGNHDMYCGGGPYYKLIDRLGQPASYFCLRNSKWQFVAMDTGLNDHNPTGGGTGATFLRDSEVAWLHDKVNNAGGRRTVLLSHHQLFTAYDEIDKNEVNMRLYPQVSALLSQVSLWLWGHEHNFVLYGPYMGLQRARLIGHGAFPVGVDELPTEPKFPDVPLVKDASGNDIRLGTTGGLYNHGYAIMRLNGSSATISYYQDSDEINPLYAETLP